MAGLDAEKYIDVVINANSEYNFAKVDLAHLNKTIEVKIPNDIVVGQKIRLKELGYIDSSGNRGDLYLIITDVKRNYGTCSEERKKVSMQKMLCVKDDYLSELNDYLAKGWRVVEFKLIRGECYVYAYVLIEK